MHVALAIIGSEILSGHIQDLNIHFLANWLKRHGHELAQVVVVPDKGHVLLETLKNLKARFPIVVTSGGLGPTRDDITKDVLSSMLGSALCDNQQAAKMVSSHYQRINRPWTKETNHYHLLPRQVQPLFNPSGLAPGLHFTSPQVDILCLPGVPMEFQDMIEFHLKKILQAHATRNGCVHDKIDSLIFKTWRIPEEKIFFELCPKLWQCLEEYGTVSSLPKSTGVDIIVSLRNADKQKTLQEILKRPEIKMLLAYFWQVGELELAEFVLQQARKKKVTIATAESCTGGLIASKLTDVAGCSDVYLGSWISYSNHLKEQMLQIDPSLIQKYGAVSCEVVAAMAQNAQRLSGADLVVATSGIAGPGGGSREKPVGTLAMAYIAQDGKIHSSLQKFNGNRILLKNRFSDFSLFQFLRAMNIVTLPE